MMPAGKLVRLVLDNALRSRGDFVLSAFGIVIGIASYVFFLSLAMGGEKVNFFGGQIVPVNHQGVMGLG